MSGFNRVGILADSVEGKTTFTITLPLEQEASVPVFVAPSSTANADQGQDLVDDEKHDMPRELLSKHEKVASVLRNPFHC